MSITSITSSVKSLDSPDLQVLQASGCMAIASNAATFWQIQFDFHSKKFDD